MGPRKRPPRFFGLEQEFAVAQPGVDERTPAWLWSSISALIVSAALRCIVHLPACRRGIFLPTGGRLRAEAGDHPECSTPECSDPWEVLRHMLAGERLVHQLARRISPSILVFKGCFDYSGSGAAWGCRESYFFGRDARELRRQLLPHLITRIVYTGAGGFDSLHAGVRFVLSPRVPHLHRSGPDPGLLQGVVLSSLSEGTVDSSGDRVHITCGESTSSHLSTWLKFGTTALVIALIEAGDRPAAGLETVCSWSALKQVAEDPTCTRKLPMLRGPPLTALEIQRRLLESVERRLGAPFLPEWAPYVCRHWRRVLDLLASAPHHLDTALDWRIKRALYGEWLRSRGLSWEVLDSWNDVLPRLRTALMDAGLYSPVLDAADSAEDRAALENVVRQVTPWFQEHELTWEALPLLRLVRDGLFELETRYGQLGPDGIFEQLDRYRLLDHRIVGDDEVDHAASNPPAVGRARVRAEFIRQLSSERHRYRVYWSGILDAVEGRWLDLSDLSEETPRWIVLPRDVLDRDLGPGA